MITKALEITCLLALFSFVFSEPAAAGSAPGVLKCKSLTRGTVTLEGNIPGDYETFDLRIKKGNEEYAIKSLDTIDRDMKPEERSRLEDDGVIDEDRLITVVKDFDRGVFTLVLRTSREYDLRLYALPQTVRARIRPNSEKASFDAMLLEGRIPGESANYPNRRAIRMRCTYDHSI